jgi:hypothetical protein
MRKFLLLLIFACLAKGQTGNALIRQFPGAPTGTCSFLQLAINGANGDFYSCESGAWMIVSGGGTGFYQTVQDEGGAQTQRIALNFVGAGVSCADDTTRTTCTITGGGASPLTVEEADGAPTISSVVKIQFDQADGFLVTDEGGGNVQIDIGTIPEARLDSLIARDSEIILGRANLTTTGAVPYVSASGTLNQDADLNWSAGNKTLIFGSALDVALSRGAAGLLQVNSASPGVYRDLMLRSLYIQNDAEATCDSTTRGKVTVVQGGSGVDDTLRVCLKSSADVYAWRPLQ